MYTYKYVSNRRLSVICSSLVGCFDIKPKHATCVTSERRHDTDATRHRVDGETRRLLVYDLVPDVRVDPNIRIRRLGYELKLTI